MLLKHEAQTDDVMMLMEKCSKKCFNISGSSLFLVFNGVNVILHVSVTRASLRVQTGPGDAPSSCQVSFQILTLISPTGQSSDVTDCLTQLLTGTSASYLTTKTSKNQRKATSHHFIQY